MGIAVPFLYFGIQIAAAPFFPGYSFLARDASTLGSNGSSLPALFNVGSPIVGIATFIAAWGFFYSFRLLGIHPFYTSLATVALVSSGLAHVNAVLFPLPDLRHTDSLLALVALLPIMSGMIQRFSIMAGVDTPWYQTFLNDDQGLLQRIGAVIVFGPIAVGAWYFVQHLKNPVRVNVSPA